MVIQLETRRSAPSMVAGLAIAAVLFAACSGGTSSTAPTAAASAASSAAAASGAASAAASAAAPSAAASGPVVPPKYTSGPATPGAVGATTIRSNEHETVPASSVKAMVDYCTGKTGVQATVSTSVHNQFQDQFNQFMQATPDDIVKWFTGERLRFPARNGLLTSIDDVWGTIAANYSAGMAQASQGDDGKKYAVPIVSYPWVVLYSKSVFQQKGYTVPKTWDEFVALAKKMQADSLIPLAFADKDGWPAMGTFDVLNMRMNGYQFHADLLAGKQKWTDPKVQDVFKKWAELLPYTQPDPLGRTWQEGAQAWANGKAGMYFLGTFASQQVPAAQQADVDFFPFPTLGTQYDSEMGVDAPVDAWILSKAPQNLPADKAMLECFGTGEAQMAFLGKDQSQIPAAKVADTSSFTAQQKKMADIIGSSKGVAQFLDRDTRSDFAGAQGMQALLQDFLKNPSQDLAAYTAKIQGVYDSLPPQ
jgi:multiple sugar transport system substrate-binding protein